MKSNKSTNRLILLLNILVLIERSHVLSILKRRICNGVVTRSFTRGEHTI